MRTVIGVDAGGTSTKALLVDESGRRRGAGRAGPGNPTSAGVDVAADNLAEVALAAWADRDDAALAAPERVVVTAAGVMSADVVAKVAGALASSGLECPVEIVGDALGAYWSAATEASGSVLIVGTGTTAARIGGGDLVRTADGLGWLLGDGGSGFWVGREVVRAAAADIDGHGESTALTALVLAQVGPLPSAEDAGSWRDARLNGLVRWVYARRPVELAAFAPLAFDAAGDAVADGIVAGAVALVLRRMECVVADDGAPIVLTGGLLGEGSPLAEALAQRWPGRCRRAADGTAGAAMLALRRVGVEAGPDELARVRRVSRGSGGAG